MNIGYKTKLPILPAYWGSETWTWPTKRKFNQSGGRLDLLLTNEKDGSMFEVEVMLGSTDESHIIRTIEYWDLEKRRRPQRQHCAVLVAEKITSRFFNVIQLFSLSIPIIAIQVNIVEGHGNRLLHFTKILDIYEEPELSSSGDTAISSEQVWLEDASWTVDCAKAVISIVTKHLPGLEPVYLKNYISLRVGRSGTGYVWLKRRTGNQSQLNIWLDDSQWAEAQKLIVIHGVQGIRKQNTFRINCDTNWVDSHRAFLSKLAELITQTANG